MANETTTTSLTEFVQDMIGVARTVETQGADLSDYCLFAESPDGAAGVTFPYYDEQVLASVAEGTDLTNTEMTATDVTITPGEYGLMATVTDLTTKRARDNVAASLGRVMGEGYKAAKNRAIYALCDGFSTALGTTNVDITEALIQQAVATLRAKKAPGELVMPVTPWVLEDILGLYSTNTNYTADALRNQVVMDGTLPPIHGVTPLLIDNLAAGTGTGGIDEADTKTAIYSVNAIGFVQEYDFRIETDRDISMRGNEIVATASFGVGEIKDDWGVELLVDNKD